MRIIEIKKAGNGSHSAQTSDFLKIVPDGCAVIPEDMECENFPFGEIEVEEIDGVMTVTKWTAGTIPEPEPQPKPEPTSTEIINALLGVTENE